MQIKKDSVYNALLSAAEEEFFEKGFEGASIRSLVKRADTTTGNFYNYFSGKEEIFHILVSDVQKQFHYFFSHHDELGAPNELWDIQDVSVWKTVLFAFFQKIIPRLDRRFILLMDCSKGSSYEKEKFLFQQSMEQHFEEHIQQFSPNYPYPQMGKILSEQFITGMISIIKEYINDPCCSHLLVEYILFFAIGVMGILKREDV